MNVMSTVLNARCCLTANVWASVIGTPRDRHAKGCVARCNPHMHMLS